MQLCGREIKGLLVDIDGVLYVGNEAIEGALEAIERLRVPHVYLTNTTTRSVAHLAEKLRGFGFSVEPGQVLSAPMAALDYLRQKGSPPARLVVSAEVAQDFVDYPQALEEAQAILVGDIGDAWSWDLLNQLFGRLVAGAELIALHKNKFWQTEAGLCLDIGAFVAGLEYASGVEATVVGKPSAAFFGAALNRLKIAPGEAAMIGDDIDSDVGGAQAQGILGVLVKTGKYRDAYVKRSSIKPDLILESIAELREA